MLIGVLTGAVVSLAVLAIAGSDPWEVLGSRSARPPLRGLPIPQADVEAFAVFSCYGISVITALTAWNAASVRGAPRNSSKIERVPNSR